MGWRKDSDHARRDVTNTRENVPAEMLLLQIYPSGDSDDLKLHCDM